MRFPGFNSYTQQLCIDHAVGQDDAAPKYAYNIVKAEGIAQSVTYKTEVISKMSDITDALDVRGHSHLFLMALTNDRAADQRRTYHQV